MPLIVDHDARRDELSAVVAHIIATRGLEAVTVRATADAAGYSTRVVSHYFTGKRELLLYCYRYISERSTRRLVAEMQKPGGNLETALFSLLPFHEEARQEWLVWVAFWGVAIADPEFSEIQRRQFSESQGVVLSLLAPDDHDPEAHEHLAREILSALMGMAVQAAFNPGEWPRQRQEAFIHRLLDRR
jgi:AcrR family transcriptional regulator